MAESVHLNRRGVMFVLSSPSGAGKTTISRKMLAADPDIALSISATTRPMRPGETDGVDYHFVDVDRFKTMAADGEFLEWAHVFGHRYGTPRDRSEEHTSELQSLMRISSAVFCMNKQTHQVSH